MYLQQLNSKNYPHLHCGLQRNEMKVSLYDQELKQEEENNVVHVKFAIVTEAELAHFPLKLPG